MEQKNEQNHPLVHLVDDDPSCLESTTRLLQLYGYRIRGFRSPVEFLKSLPADSVGCVVTDLRMPEMDGLTLQRRLEEKNSLLSVIFLTAYGTIPTSVAAMRSGAVDFLTKDAPLDHLVRAIERALKHSARSLERATANRRNRRRLQRLTPREHQVLALVAKGRLNKQIAAELGIHERTVKLHRSSGMRKMETDSVAELSVVWHQLEESGLVSSADDFSFPKGQ